MSDRGSSLASGFFVERSRSCRCVQGDLLCCQNKTMGKRYVVRTQLWERDMIVLRVADRSSSVLSTGDSMPNR